MPTDQYEFDDPRSRHARFRPPVQQQPEPGLQSRMEPVPQLGETSYRAPDDRPVGGRSHR